MTPSPHPHAKYLSLGVLVLQNSMLALTMRYSRTMDGPMYLASTAVVVAEAIKCAVSCVLLKQEEGEGGVPITVRVFSDPYGLLRLMVPAALYTVQNNLAYFAMSHLEAATYQLLYQLKILTTALCSVLLLGRSLSWTQWFSLCVLSVGVGLVQTANTAPTANADEATRNSFVGFVAVLAACCSSGLAGVYFELVLKGSKTSLWVRNVQLSLIGLLFGLVPVMKDQERVAAMGFFHGYNTVVWVVVLLQALGGLLVALVVKYADNILKGFATSISIIISCVCSYFLFNTVVNTRFVVGALCVLYAVFLYSSAPPKRPAGNPTAGSGGGASSPGGAMGAAKSAATGKAVAN